MAHDDDARTKEVIPGASLMPVLPPVAPEEPEEEENPYVERDADYHREMSWRYGPGGQY